MKDSFKFKSRNGTTIYTAAKFVDDSTGDIAYIVSWEGVGISEGGSRPYNVETIKHHIDEGTWVLVEEPVVPQMISSGTGGWVFQKDGALTVNLDAKGVYAGIGLGVARPILETRKIGKIPMHMVIDGFPLALKEVAKVMEWAERVKGYKLHDWKNLPNPEVAFPSAGYRHMVDNSEMKYDDVPALERVDHESGIVHLAHEIFNKVAELQLIMSGKIK